MKTPRQTPPNVNDRNTRLKAALQANIARRKAQVRGRADPAAPEAEDNEPQKEPESGPENGPEPEMKKE